MNRHKTSVLLTHAYLAPLDPKQWNEGKLYPPLGTLQAAAVLREAGYEVQFTDTQFDANTQQVKNQLIREKPHYFVIYDDHFNYLTKMCLTNMREAAFRMIRAAKEAGAVAIVSSSDASDQYELYLDEGADFVILGEGEETLKELLTNHDISTGTAPYIKGVACRSGHKTHASRRPVITDLDSLPLPAWDLLDLSPYIRTWNKNHGSLSLNIYTTRGCPFKCNWCAKPLYGNRYHARSPQHVINELVWLKNIVDFQHIWFCDDIFGLKPGWVEQFAGLVKDNNLQFKFTMQGRADLLCKEEIVKALSDAGCETVWMGAESGSGKILDAMDKGQTVDHIYKSTRLLRKWNIRPAFFLQFGYPGETMEDIQLTLKMVRELLPADIGVSISYPLPGTKFYESVRNELGSKANWTDSDELALMFRNNYSPLFYKTLHRYIHYYFRSLQSEASMKSLFTGATPDHQATARSLLRAPYYFLRRCIEGARMGIQKGGMHG